MGLKNQKGGSKTPSSQLRLSGYDTKIVSSLSTANLGALFEQRIQASFALLMLLGGYAPGLPPWPISGIKLQGRHDVYRTDDMIVFVRNPESNEECKLLCQVKHSISISKGNNDFEKFILLAWRDFQNSELFTKGMDRIALITGPLSKVDIDHTRILLDKAKQLSSSKLFFTQIEQGNFVSSDQRKKLDVFRYHLNTAVGGECSNEDLFSFLQHLCLLGYDLDERSGIVLSLLHTQIALHNLCPANVWPQIVDLIQSQAIYANYLTPDQLHEKMKGLFKQGITRKAPHYLHKVDSNIDTPHWGTHQQALALASLVGAWQETYNEDSDAVGSLTSSDYSGWVAGLRPILDMPKNPIEIRNGGWHIRHRAKLFDSVAGSILDTDLQRFKSLAIRVLSENRPEFTLSKSDRWAAPLYGKTPAYSALIRKGIAEGIALAATHSEKLTHCTTGLAKSVAHEIVSTLLKQADWVRWGSLNHLLPSLAEAAPDAFLDAVQEALDSDDSPFLRLFKEEGVQLMESNHLVGLYWGLEVLAWGEESLVRASHLLAELATLDPGGSWSNRPINSLVNIYLPWQPQTLAEEEKQNAALKSISSEFPEIAWQLLLMLLPNVTTTSHGTYTPKWLHDVSKHQDREVPAEEYWSRVEKIADLIFEMVKTDSARLPAAVDHLENLPIGPFGKVLEHLKSVGADLTTVTRNEIWDRLNVVIDKHRRFASAKWAMEPARVKSMEEVAETLKPSDPLLLHRLKFGFHDADYSTQSEKTIAELRKDAIDQILEVYGEDGIVNFAKQVECPRVLGEVLADSTEHDFFSTLLPQLLLSDDGSIWQLNRGYVKARHDHESWQWIDDLDMTSWNPLQQGRLLSYCPFCRETWDRADSLSAKGKVEYWSNATMNTRQLNTADLLRAIEEFLKVHRSSDAIECLRAGRTSSQPIDASRCAETLLSMAKEINSSSSSIVFYDIAKLVAGLKADPTTDSQQLLEVEWTYLPILLANSSETRPLLTDEKLAKDPNFFCQVIQTVYRSSDPDSRADSAEKPAKDLASILWRLLNDWSIPPGTQTDGLFDGEVFKDFLEKVKEISTETGHQGIALEHIGRVLIYTPKDPQGLWIHKSVAAALNDKDMKALRDGFFIGLFNSRGVYSVDPTGASESKLAELYKSRASTLDDASYTRFAASLRKLADQYVLQAQQTKEDHAPLESD